MNTATLIASIFYLLSHNTSLVIPAMNEVLDVDQNGVQEKIIGEYVCSKPFFAWRNGWLDSLERENYQKFLSLNRLCTYYLDIYSGDELIFDNIPVRKNLMESLSHENLSESLVRVRSKISEPGVFGSDMTLGDMTNDGTQDLLLVFFIGFESHRAVVIDIKNREFLGCQFFGMDTAADTKITSDGKIEYFCDGCTQNGWKIGEPRLDSVILGKDFFMDCDQVP